jgi:transmembrane sensor
MPSVPCAKNWDKVKDDRSHTGSEEFDFVKKLKIPYGESKEEVWERLAERLDDVSPAQAKMAKMRKLRPWTLAVAACLVLLALVYLGGNSYTRTISAARGQQVRLRLPDGSKVSLNAESQVTYKPLVWYFQREIRLEGEGFFEVREGRQFSVVSPAGTTTVLGTSFNVYARDTNYRVFCATGKVSVSSRLGGETVWLNPNQMAVWDGKLKVRDTVDQSQPLAWRAGYFSFQAQTLTEVIAEIERQYDIQIVLDDTTLKDRTFTGRFRKFARPDSTLELICTTIAVKFVQTDPQSFQILNPD